ncbi:hypothetical protein SGQ83_06425 [Flavobacterium sp. Fl-318]|uniref:Type II toxin-antitoxin system RelE/ParE family toxin n=1 Tax=Flavobacterium cupriresistens TaxID=2893885 RepID=A0ABU4R8R9_9FLAO|nr:hypothetical protein [Flavobacterium sp. F-323]MDX6188975.1 hypothetical protein [Flavobacterium sp. Fl-318]UFH44244.1 hypothetical protein LNP23_08480 [Flavobacterium sp. F-323]
MVGKIEVVFTRGVIRYLDNLVVTLYEKEYFGSVDAAERYVSNIYDAVPEKIQKGLHKKTPTMLRYLGSDYIFCKTNSRTTWYVFFEKSKQNYLITGILNNYCIEAKNL